MRSTRSRRARLVRRFSGYWRAELLNAVLVPVAVVVIAAPPSALTLLTTLPANVGLLVLGGLYWRAKLHQLEARPATLHALLPWADRVQTPLVLLTTVAVVGAALGWLVPSLTVGDRDRVVATVTAGLAVAEYVNYFHRQLQHFDHLPDLRRLLSGRGFQRSHLARDLELFRSARR